ncbi:NUDIX hydrolase [Halomonas sp. M20]|uniref:NUDIX hydrolase n=1 Tax=Halomonas sp. M20 TaxID=2763264 RepID=UPI001D0B2919|nr:NUDIX hydrolase [Halomonas sp. M20]
MHSTPKPAALAVVLRGQDALLVRRKNEPDAGLWGFPGGRIESGETVFECAVRELAEETGIHSSAQDYLTTIDVIRREDDEVRFHYVLTAVLCDYLSGVPQAADDAMQAAWIKLTDIAEARIPLSEHVASVAQMALALREGSIDS